MSNRTPKGIDDEDFNEQNNFEVEKVLGHRYDQNNQLFFLVKWKGWPHQFNSWEIENNFKDSKIILQEYMQTIGGSFADMHTYIDDMNNRVIATDNNASDLDISNFIFVLDKASYLSSIENLLANDFISPVDRICTAKQFENVVLPCKDVTNQIHLVSAPNQQVACNSTNPEQSVAEQTNNENKIKEEDPKENIQPKESLPQFITNMCEPDQKPGSDQNKTKSRFFKLMKKEIGLNMSKRIQRIESSENSSIFGSFKYGDVPLRILKMEVVAVLVKEVQTNCLIEWAHRKNGFKPKNSVFSNHVLKQKSPLLLINYYESHLHVY
jgi:hypothetical protein